MNNAGQINSAAGLQAQLANQQAGLAGNQARQGAASQLANMGNMGFGMGQQINAQQAQQGAQQQGLLQMLMGGAQNQFQGFTGQPGQSLTYPIAALGGMPNQGSTTTTSQQPGLFNMLGLLMGM